MGRYRILWQSSTAISKFPDYKAGILRHAKKILSPDIQLEVRGVDKGTSALHFMAFDFLNNAQVFKGLLQAQKEGFDAVAIGCFLDPILDELREVMDIPVQSLGETGMLTACMIGKLFSVVSYVPQLNNKRYAELIHKYGLKERSAGLTSFDLPFEALDNGFKDPSEVIEKFTRAGREAVKKGAEVLLPGCGCLNLILAENHISEIDGATVLDVSGVLMKSAELMLVLRKVSGTRVSRRGFYEAPPRNEIESVLKIYQ
jgi:allantoin racemase